MLGTCSAELHPQPQENLLYIGPDARKTLVTIAHHSQGTQNYLEKKYHYNFLEPQNIPTFNTMISTYSKEII